MKAVKTKIPMGKGKETEIQDKDFEEEKAWLLLRDIPSTQDIPVAGELPQNRVPGGTGTSVTDHNVPPEEEDGLECGCCFSPVPFVRSRRSQHSEPLTNSFTAKYDSMSGRPLILHGMYGFLRFQPPRRAQFQDRLH